MPIIQAEYLKFPIIDKDSRFIEYVYRPHIQLMLNYKRGKILPPHLVLLDTGADRNLFPAYIADALRIKIKKGKKFLTMGIGNQPLEIHRHQGIKFFLDGYSFETEIEFSYECNFPLVGGIGFFDKFKKVTFMKRDEIIKLEY